ncbi:recombinase family protein [Enterococcus faecalis]|uniref:recombinase family protein n=1 Tax=Enterococcus faecalis TaxID=1351 RepID=UPI003F651E48
MLDLSDENPYSEFLLTVMAGVNQLERDLIRMRQKEGIALKKKEGKFKGRLTRYTETHECLRYALDLYDRREMTVKKFGQSLMYQNQHCIVH